MCRNVWFSLASTAIVSACIFLFCVFFSIITNIEYMVTMAETTMGITVFFDEDLSEAEIQALGEQIQSDKAGLIKSMNFISAEEAWNSFQTDYFGEEADLAEGFAEDNPLAGSASYEIFLKNISSQDDMVKYECNDCRREFTVGNKSAEGQNLTCPYCQSSAVEWVTEMSVELMEEEGLDLGCSQIFFPCKKEKKDE